MRLWFFILMSCGFLFTIEAQGASSADALDRVVAVVNSSVITQSELTEAMNKTKRQMMASHITVPNAADLRAHVLDQIINRTIQLDMAKQAGAEVTEQEIDHAIASIAKNNKVSIARLYSEVQRQGLSKEAYRKEIKEEYLIHKVQRQSIGNKTVVTPQEVDEFMHSAAWLLLNDKEYHIEDILITLPEAPSTQQMLEAKKHAEALVLKLRAGTNFQETAIAVSNGDRALQGGDLGWRKLPEVPSAFAGPLAHMKDNDIFGPIQTPNGFHIIHLAGIRTIATAANSNKEQDRKKIQALLYDRKYEEALQSWIIKIRGESFINTHPEG